MEVFRQSEKFGGITRPIFAAIGMFDGVHQGHQEIIRQMVHAAEAANGYSLIVSFTIHPSAVLRPDHPTPLIYPPSVNMEILAETRANGLLLLDFDEEMRRLSPDGFIGFLLNRTVRLKSICVGHNFRFGHEQSGDFQTLKALGKRYGFEVCKPGFITHAGEPISSTRIRKEIGRGNLDEASFLLGRPYHWQGKVEHGDKRGRLIGVPTANIRPDQIVLPPWGVYAVRADLDGRILAGIANLGLRPTIQGVGDSSNPLLEIHLFDFDEDLYGREIKVMPVSFIRPERKFDSLETLRTRISEDITKARNSLNHMRF